MYADAADVAFFFGGEWGGFVEQALWELLFAACVVDGGLCHVEELDAVESEVPAKEDRKEDGIADVVAFVGAWVAFVGEPEEGHFFGFAEVDKFL